MASTKIDATLHANSVGEDATLVCAVCGFEQTFNGTCSGSVMYGNPDVPESVECDCCRELAWSWGHEIAEARRG